MAPPRAASVSAPLAAVVLDLDGTLLDHAVSARRALGAWLADRGVTPTEELAAAWAAAEERHFAAWREGRVSFVEQRRARLRDLLPLLGEQVGDDEALGLPPDQVLDVGDEHEVDVLGARAAGLRAVHLDRLGAGPADEAERVEGLRDLVRHLGGAR